MVLAGIVLIVVAVILIILGVAGMVAKIVLWVGVGLLVVAAIVILFDRLGSGRGRGRLP
jgi:hypothetical protein